MSTNEAIQKLKVPGILMVVFGVSTELAGIWNIISSAMGIGYDESQMPPGTEGFMVFMKSFGVGIGVVQLVTGVLMILGGMNMLRGRGYGLAMTATIIALIPMLNCCCIVTLPVGIWALVLLIKPEIKAAFQSAG